MAVAVDSTGAALIGASSVTTVNYNNITVGASLSNGALVATLALGVSFLSSGATAIWDSGGTNQSMTLVGSVSFAAAGHNVYAAIFALRNPTSGTNTLKFSWTTAGFPTCEAISLTGVEQSSDAAAFRNFNSATSGTSTPPSTTITSAVNNMVIGLYAPEAIVSINNTQIYLDNTSPGADSAACRAAGAASVTVTGTTSGSNSQVICGFDVVAAGAGPAFIAAKNKAVLQAVKRAAYW